MKQAQTVRWTFFAAGSVLLAVVVGMLVVPSAVGAGAGDIETLTKRYIEFERTIRLTSTQEAIKREALEAIPAPCCSDNSAYTCCCPCNMARAIWGLSAYLITEKSADAVAVRTAVQDWLSTVAPKGHSGDTCYTAGCGRAISDNGCGGMNPTRLKV